MITPLKVTDDLLCSSYLNNVQISNESAEKEIIIWLPLPKVGSFFEIVQLAEHSIRLNTNCSNVPFLWRGKHQELVLRGGTDHFGSILHIYAKSSQCWTVFASLTDNNSLALKD